MKRKMDTAQYLRMVKPIIRRAGERVADDDPEQLAALISIRGMLDAAILKAVAGQRQNGITWEAIGAATGVTRQAALMHYGPKVEQLAHASAV